MIVHVPGPCTITFHAISLGLHKDGVKIRPQVFWLPVTDDEGGSEPIDYIFGGRTALIELILQEPNLVVALELLGGLLQKSTGSYDVGTLVHTGSTSVAYPLIITEARSGGSWTAPLAIPLEPEIPLTATEETKIPLRFLIQQNSLGQLFSAIPTYMGGST